MRLQQNKSPVSRVPKTAYFRGSKQGNPKHVRPLKIRAKTLASKTFNVLLIGALAILVGYNLLLKPSPRIYLNSTIYHSETTYLAAASKLSQPLSDRNKLTYNGNLLIKSLKAEFPEISQAKVNVPIVGQYPTITINISKPLFRLASSGNQFIVNQIGVIVPRGKIIVSSLTPLNDKSGIQTKDGQVLLNPDSVRFVEQVLAQATAAKVTVSSLTLPIQAQEIDVYTKDTAYYTKFYLGGEPLVQAGQWLAARHQFAQKNITPGQYLDVRVSGKIFYK